MAPALVLVSLLLLVVVPLVAIRRTTSLRDRVSSVAGPARTRVADLRSAVALDGAASRWYLLTGSAEARASHERARLFGSHALARLGPLVARLRPEVAVELDSLTRFLTQAAASIDSLFAGQISRAAYSGRLSRQQERLVQAMVIATRLDQAIGASADADMAAVEAIDDAAAVATIALVALALVAAAFVALLGHRYRVLALRQVALLDTLRVVGESRTRLVRGFTHDVKNPLGAADGFLSLMEDGVHGDLSPKHRETVGRVRKLIHSALNLIGQLLEIERADAGQLEIHVTSVDVTATAQDVVEAFRAEATAKGLTLSSNGNSDGRVIIESDQERLRQVVANLISNAVKYTPAGGRIAVDVATERRADEPTKSVAVISVTDDGPGIPAEKQALLFQEFTRFSPGAAEGSGIGLAISQRVARALGGQITVESQAGRGSTFKLMLPLRAPAAQGSTLPGG